MERRWRCPPEKLAPRRATPAIVLFGDGLDETAGIGSAGIGQYFIVGGFRPSELDIVCDDTGEEVGFLQTNSHQPA